MDEIEKGLKEALNGDENLYTITIFNGQSNRSVMQAQAAQLVHAQYDCICTVGTACTQLVAEQLKKNRSKKPLVFTAVADPEKLGIMPQKFLHVTGISSSTDYEIQLALIKKLKPSLKSLLLIYDPAQGAGRQTDKETIVAHGQTLGIRVTSLEIAHPHDIMQRVPPFLSSVDAVMILKDHTVVTAIDPLVSLCDEYGVCLYASDLNSSAQGAALAFGIEDYEYGKQAALLIDQICREKKPAHTLPIQSEQGKRLQLNRKHLRPQKIELSPEQLEEFQQDGGSII
jgi:putative ABC transport system substrate-binding protein